MYRFDDKWRKRLLEDALVAELLGGALGTPGAVRTEETATAPAAAAAPGRNVPVSKSNA
jgi:hypothetical protein